MTYAEYSNLRKDNLIIYGDKEKDFKVLAVIISYNYTSSLKIQVRDIVLMKGKVDIYSDEFGISLHKDDILYEVIKMSLEDYREQNAEYFI